MAWGSANSGCLVLTHTGAGLGAAGGIPVLLKALGWLQWGWGSWQPVSLSLLHKAGSFSKSL